MHLININETFFTFRGESVNKSIGIQIIMYLVSLII